MQDEWGRAMKKCTENANKGSSLTWDVHVG